MKNVVCLCVCLIFTACGQEQKSTQSEKIAMLTSAGGLGDRSYNDAAHNGLMALKNDGADVSVLEPNDVSEGERYLTELANAGCKLIFVLEYAHADVVKRVAPLFPQNTFVVFNLVVDEPNVISVLFDVHQSSFLAGALSAMITKDTSNPKINSGHTISAIGGAESPGIDIFTVGYVEGAKYIDPNMEVLVSYANTFSDPVKGKEMALAQISKGSDIIFAVAGGTGEGVFEAAKSKNIYAIGVDSDQDHIAQGTILTSVVKKMDQAVYRIGDAFRKGTLQAGIMKMPMPEGTSLSPMQYTKQAIKPEYFEKLTQIEQDIIAGKIKVTDASLIGK